MSTSWLSSQFSPYAPGFWLIVSFLSTTLLVSMQSYIPARWRGLVWFAHWLIIPYLGLLMGGLSPRLLGLAGHDWLAGLGLGLGLIFAVVILLTLARAITDIDAPAANDLTDATGQNVIEGQRVTGEALPRDDLRLGDLRLGWHTISSTLLWCGIEQFHWVFLRGSIWEMLQTLPNPPELVGYWAIWCAAGIIFVELLLLRPGFYALMIQVVALVTTSILFFYTLNFWLCWVMHVAVQLLTAPPAILPLAPLRLSFTRR
jgi:hypothetical protein